MSSELAPSSAPIQMLRLQQVCQATGLGRSMIYQLEAEERFPRRIKIGRRAVGWIDVEVQQWLAQRIQDSRPNPPADACPARAGAGAGSP
jgi:prophage regulatory protein